MMIRSALALGVAAMFVVGCGEAPDAPANATNEPCVETPTSSRELTEEELQDSIYNPAKVKERRMWADSWLYAEAPELEVEEWLSDTPETKGKYIMIEFWGTYCPPCRRSASTGPGLHLSRLPQLQPGLSAPCVQGR